MAFRVLLISRALPALVPGGLERHVEDLALGLAEAGCQVRLLTAPLPAGEQARLAEAGLTLHEVPFANPRHYTARYLAGIGGLIHEIVKRHPIDVIHAQEFALGLWRPERSAPPLVLTVHGTITSETALHPDVYAQLTPVMRARAWLRFGRRFLYAPVWRRALRTASRVLVDSTFTRGELARLAPECLHKVRPTPLAIRETGPEPPPHEDARRRLDWTGLHLLTTGRIEWQKGHGPALHALAALRDLPWHYTIAGTGAHAGAIRELIRQLGLEGRVTLAGWLDEPTKRMMLAGADLFLWPERTHPAFGLAGLEALLASTPVLATRRGAIPEVVGERGGWLVDGGDPAALAEALRPLLADPRHLAQARAGLREDALRRFSFPAMIEAVMEQYRELAP